jgi:hypothetical protein
VLLSFRKDAVSENCCLDLPLASSIAASPLVNGTQKRYAIPDNDWESTGFIPFLIGVDAGIDILGISSSSSNCLNTTSINSLTSEI